MELGTRMLDSHAVRLLRGAADAGEPGGPLRGMGRLAIGASDWPHSNGQPKFEPDDKKAAPDRGGKSS